MHESKEEHSTSPTPQTDWLDWPLYIMHSVIFAFVLLIFDPMQRIAIRFGRHAHEMVIVWMSYCLVATLRLTGVRFKYIGKEKIDANGPFILVMNHQSMHDITILYNLFYKNYPRFVAKKELSRFIPSISYNLRHGGNAIIDRNNPKQAIPAIGKLGRLIEQHNLAAIMFPEGTRSRTGALGKFRSGGFVALYKSAPSARIIPVTIDGSWILARSRFHPIPRGTEIRVTIGDELKREDFKGPIEMLQTARTVIEEELVAR